MLGHPVTMVAQGFGVLANPSCCAVLELRLRPRLWVIDRVR